MPVATRLLIAAVAIAIVTMLVLHLTGVVGPR